MKKTLSAFVLFVSIQTSYAQLTREWSLGYTYASPTGSMMQHINQGNGFVMDFHMMSPTGKFSWGADLNYTIYGFDKSRQQYTFPDGTTADMDINVNNSFTNLMASGRYNLITGKKLVPYIGAKAGYSWFTTNLNIYDPDDLDSCEPVETDILQKDGTFVFSIGGGVRYDLANVFLKLRKEFIYVNLSAYHTRGGAVNYMNTDAPNAQHHSGSAPSRVSDVEAEFINTQTQVIHKHHIGYVYSSAAQMMDFRLSVIFRSFH
jgi:opacity protein-like surface antigen